MQLPIIEKISDGLREAEILFLSKCKKLDIEYDLQCDTPKIRGYEIRDKNLAKSFVDLITDLPKDIIMTINDEDPLSDLDGILKKRRGGFIISFHDKPIIDTSEENEEPISDSGHWQLLTDKDKKKRRPKMSFLQDDDAKKVDSGNTMAQQGHKMKELDASGFSEDQYKSPTSKHRRSQAPFRSSFDPKSARSFGGITEQKYPSDNKREFNKLPSIAGQMIPPYLEPSSSVASVGAVKSGSPEIPVGRDGKSNKSLPKQSITSKDPGERRKPKYRSDLTDILTSRYESPMDIEEQIDMALEDSQPRTRIGRTTDPSLYTRQIQLTRAVPNPSNEPSEKIAPEDETTVVPDDVAARERRGDISVDNPHFQVGAAGIRPQSTGSAKDAGGSAPISNVSIQKTGPGAFFPDKVTVTKSELPLPSRVLKSKKKIRLRGIA